MEQEWDRGKVHVGRAAKVHRAVGCALVEVKSTGSDRGVAAMEKRYKQESETWASATYLEALCDSSDDGDSGKRGYGKDRGCAGNMCGVDRPRS